MARKTNPDSNNLALRLFGSFVASEKKDGQPAIYIAETLCRNFDKQQRRLDSKHFFGRKMNLIYARQLLGNLEKAIERVCSNELPNNDDVRFLMFRIFPSARDLPPHCENVVKMAKHAILQDDGPRFVETYCVEDSTTLDRNKIARFWTEVRIKSK